MSENGIVIQQIIRDSSTVVDNCISGINANQSQIDTLNTKITAVKEDVADVAAQRLSSYLLNLYGTTTSLFVNGALYNQVYDTSGNLTDWRILHVTFDNVDPSAPHFFPINDVMFYTYGDTSNIFIPRLNFPDIGFGRKNNSGVILNPRTTNIGSAIYDSISNTTTVTVIDHILGGNDNIIYLYRAGYKDPSDSTADAFVTQWTFAQDYLLRTGGLNGTYGLIPTRDNLSKGNTVMTSNKDKNELIPGMFDSYT